MITRDNPYYGQVQLLVNILPIVGREACFALKGGTAINLFVQDMPRLSVDIDLAFVPVSDRASTLHEIDAALSRIGNELSGRAFGYRVSIGKQQEGKTCGLMISDGANVVKIEVSPVLRGEVYPGAHRHIVTRAEAEFGFVEVPVVSLEDLYAGKIVAALDRQHPRDLFDVQLLFASDGISEELFRAFLVYVISHDGSIARILNPTLKSLKELFTQQFEGMTEQPVTLIELEQTRNELISVIHERMNERYKDFLLSFKRGEPQWELLGISHVKDLPAVRWKLHNLAQMESGKRQTAISTLERVLNKPKREKPT